MAVLRHAAILDQLSASSSSTPAITLSPQQTSYNAVIKFPIIRARMLDQTSAFNSGRQASDFAPWGADSTLELAFAKLSLGQLGSNQMAPRELMQNIHGTPAMGVPSLRQHGSAQLTPQRLMQNGEVLPTVDIKGKGPASEVVEQKVRVHVASLIAEDGTTGAAGCVGDGVKDLAGAPLQRAGDVRRSLSAEPDNSTSNGEDIDTSVVVLIGIPEGEYGASDIFLTHRRNGYGYWIDALKHWVLVKLGLADFADDIPMEWSWVNIMGAPIYQSSETSITGDQSGDGSCVICSCMTCIHAQHRLAFERRHGVGSFPYELCQTNGVVKMKYQCLRHCVWHPSFGSAPPVVLEMMKMNQSTGPELRDVPGRFLGIRSYDSFSMEKLKPGGAVILLRLCGPMIGSLHVGPGYFISNYVPEYVYRGVPGGGALQPCCSLCCLQICAAWRAADTGCGQPHKGRTATLDPVRGLQLFHLYRGRCSDT